MRLQDFWNIRADARDHTPEVAVIVRGSDNVCDRNFAVCEVNVISVPADTASSGAATVDQPSLRSQAPIRTCRVCLSPLTRRQDIACSRRCASKLKAAITHARYPQRGAQNHNWRGGRAQHPIVYTRAFKAKHPEIARAHRLVASAIRNGTLTRPADCESCLQRIRVDAHHWDYDRPLVIEWLCRKCHVAADRLRQCGFKPTAAFTQHSNRYENVVGQTWQRPIHGRQSRRFALVALPQRTSR